MVNDHRAEGIAGHGTQIHAVNDHAGNRVVGVGSDGERLVGAVVHIRRTARTDRAAARR